MFTFRISITDHDDFYPFCLQMPGRSNNSANPHDDQKFTGHFLEQEGDLGIYHAHARIACPTPGGYDPAIGRFLGVDAMRGKYPSLSSYVYAANNPVIFVDPDGNDYELHFDDEEGTVTVSANLYAIESDFDSAEQAADFWNSQSGKFSYNVGRGSDAVSYTVNFNINAIGVEVDGDIGVVGSLNAAMLGDDAGNVYMSASDGDLGENVAGTITSGNWIQVADSFLESSTGAHEVGHALGIGHSRSGIMTRARDSQGRGDFITRGNVRTIIRNPLRGKNSTSQTGGSGVGTVSASSNADLSRLQNTRGRVR